MRLEFCCCVTKLSTMPSSAPGAVRFIEEKYLASHRLCLPLAQRTATNAAIIMTMAETQTPAISPTMDRDNRYDRISAAAFSAAPSSIGSEPSLTNLKGELLSWILALARASSSTSTVSRKEIRRHGLPCNRMLSEHVLAQKLKGAERRTLPVWSLTLCWFPEYEGSPH